MAEPFTSLALAMADAVDKRVTGAFNEAQLATALEAILPDLAPTEWEQLAKVIQVLGRVKDLLLVEGAPSADIGLIGASALDITTKTFYGPKTDAGWGAGVAFDDSGFATNSGFTLIKHKRGETGTYARTAAQMNKIGAFDTQGVSLAHWIPSDYDEDILAASNSDMLDTYIQSAFTNVRAGVPLVFPPNGELRTNQTIENPRAISIWGNNCQWRGFFGADVSTDMMLVQPTADQRLFFVRGLRASFSTGGRHVMHLSSDGAPGALLSFDLANCLFSTVSDGQGASHAVRLAGLGTHIGSVSGCELAGGVHATTADRVVYEKNMIYGYKGMLFSLIAGAYTTVIQDNAIVSRDGVTVLAGDNIHFLRNQFEQFPGYGANDSDFESQLTFYGDGARPILNCVVEGNNFGGGANCAAPVSLVANVQRARFRNNQYNPGYSTYDARLLDASVKYCTFDEQFARGVLAVGVDRDTSEPFSIYDLGTATRGIWRAANHDGTGSDLSFSSGWTAGANLALSIDASASVVHLAGTLVVGTSAGTGDLITTLPEGYRPRADTILVCSNSADNNLSRIKIQSNGQVYPAGAMPASGSAIHLPSGYRTKAANSFNVGA